MARLGLAAIADGERAMLLSKTQPVEAELRDVQRRFEMLGFRGRAAQARGLLAALSAPPGGTDAPGRAREGKNSDPPTAEPFAELTSRENEILLLVARGETNKDIAKALFISLPTVQRHVANIYAKTNCRNRSDATAYAIRRGILRV